MLGTVGCTQPFQQPVPAPEHLGNYHIFDQGVVDIDRDGNLDIFTTNCYGGQKIRRGDGTGNFGPNLVSKLGLNHDPILPGCEDSFQTPLLNSEGLHVFFRDGLLHLRSVGPDQGQGILSMSSPVEIKKNQGFKVKLIPENLPSGLVRTTLEFSWQGPGNLILEPRYLGVPLFFDFRDSIPLKNIHLGLKSLNPRQQVFTLSTNDRHGMAWADYNADDQPDVFISRGGLYGRMEDFPESYNDELMLGTKTGFKDVISASGITKDAGRARQVAWVDYDRDGRLDLYLTNIGSPNKLYHQQKDGTFRDLAPQLGLDLKDCGPFLWLDVDNDNDLELITVCPGQICLFNREKEIFRKQILGAIPMWPVKKLSAADYDQNGFMDVFIVSRAGNRMLLNNQGVLKPIKPESLGLPKQGLTGSFLDYDNDGLIDLYLLPGGLFKQNPDHTFSPATGIFPVSSPNSPYSLATWFDADNDGDRDLLAGKRHTFDLDGAPIILLNNAQPENHWLQLDLIGPPGNREAIGTRVVVTSGKLIQTSQPGLAEGSHYSQGHYRLYFGLGSHQQADRIEIFWPYGSRLQLLNVPADQRLEIQAPLSEKIL